MEGTEHPIYIKILHWYNNIEIIILILIKCLLEKYMKYHLMGINLGKFYEGKFGGNYDLCNIYVP